MPVVTILSATHCRADEVVTGAAERLGCRLLGEEILELASSRSGLSEKKLLQAVRGASFLSLNPKRERARRVAFLRAAAADVFSGDDVVGHGFAGLLIPPEVTHVLRVCLLANPEFRIERLREEAGIAEAQARRELERDDLACGEWARYVRRAGPWDQKLYDLRIPMHDHTVEQAISLVVDAASTEALRPTPESRAAMADFVLASTVAVELAERGHEADVTSSGGCVTIRVDDPPLRWERVREKLAEIAAAVPGVESADVRAGPGQSTSFYREEEFQLPTRVLLVDDEKDFVLALSERLEMRQLSPSVAYDGEEALAIVEERRPDVIVLDLRMPGMGGMEALRQLRAKHPGVEVIILTGHGTEKDEAEARQLGAFAYLQKPVEIDELERTVREANEKVRRDRADAEGDDGAG